MRKAPESGNFIETRMPHADLLNLFHVSSVATGLTQFVRPSADKALLVSEAPSVSAVVPEPHTLAEWPINAIDITRHKQLKLRSTSM